MSQRKEKKIKRLRKARIWPSILCLLLSIVINFMAFIAFVLFMLVNQVSERFNFIFANSISTLTVFESTAGSEASIIENLHLNPLFSDTLYILDPQGNIIAGYGDQDFEKLAWGTLSSEVFREIMVDFEINEHYSFCVDKRQAWNLLNQNGDLDLTILLESECFNLLDNQTAAPNDVAFSARFWTKYTYSDGRYAVMRCAAPLYYLDFGKIGLAGLAAFIVTFIPVIICFLNMIFNALGQRRLTKLLYTDPITAGRSYAYFISAGEKQLRSRKTILIADVTLMKYRSYCNFHGAQAGEELLELIDNTLSKALVKKEICAHSGKASFALLLFCTDQQQGEERVRALLQTLSEKIPHKGINFHAGIYFPEPKKPGQKALSPADCLGRASSARATLTDENVSEVAIYNDALLEQQLWTHKVEERMQEALDNEEFHVYIQPKYDPVTEKLAGGEALIRWINQEDGFIAPGKFIPIFERNGFITKIDDYMISHVAKLQADWIAAGKNVVPISVNVSRAHFANPELAQHICSLVDQYQVPHNLIEIELTESAFFDDKAALLRIVNQLRSLGFEISMDDFGAGYSSLNSLKDLPLDVLKLDADFFRGEAQEDRREIVVSQAIQLAKNLNMRIVAEGVEEKEQVDFLAGQGCDMIQGYYFAKPMPADEYAERL